MSDSNRYGAFVDKSYSWRYVERPALDRVIPDSIYTDAAKILDIGSGPGRTVGYHLGRGALPGNLTGVEPHEVHITEARKRYPNVDFIHQKIQSTPLDPGTFDLVTAQLSLRYLDNTDLSETCRNVASALRPGGLFFLLDAHPSNHVVTKSHGLENYFEEGMRQIDTPWGDRETYYYRTLGTYVNTMIDAGLTLTRMDECPILGSGWSPEFAADLDHYGISPVRFALLGAKPD